MGGCISPLWVQSTLFQQVTESQICKILLRLNLAVDSSLVRIYWSFFSLLRSFTTRDFAMDDLKSQLAAEMRVNSFLDVVLWSF
jgi:hypothetical protein